MKRNKQYIISFFIPIIIFTMVSSIIHFNFKGYKVFMVSDAHGQYISLFSYLRDFFSGNSSLFYSFSKGLGGNMLGTYAYYLASPLNFLIIFFTKKHLSSALLLLIILKIGLSGLAMFSYLKRKHQTGKTLFMFSTSYALMGFIVVYFFNPMWLDALYCTPLLLIGIDKVIDSKSSLWYGLFLFLSIISNYYMGYILCLLSCLYFSYQLLLNYSIKENKKKIISITIKFIITSFLSGLMTFFLLLPTLYELIINTNRIGLKGFSNNFNLNFLGVILSRFFIASHNKGNILNVGTPAIYTGIITLPLVYFYFINKKIKIKDKILGASIILFLILSFLIGNLNYFWHGFSSTNCFDYRYSFILSLFLIIIASQSFYKIKAIDLKHYLIFTIVFVVLSNIIIIKQYAFLKTSYIFLSGGLLILYLTILYLYHRISRREQALFKILLIFLVLSELLVNFYLSICKYEYHLKKEYTDSTLIIGEKVNNLYNEDNSFYRIEKDLFYSSLDSMLMNYKGVSSFLSTLSNNQIQFINNVGYQSSVSSIEYEINGSPLLNSLLGIKYFISKQPVFNYKLIDSFEFSKFAGKFYDLVKEEVGIYKNSEALSLGYMVQDNVYDFIEYFKRGEITNSFEVQNYFLKTMVKTDDAYFKPYKIERIDDNNFKVDINNDKDIYIMVPVSIIDKETKIHLYLNDNLIKTYKHNKTGIFKINNNFENTTLNLKIKDNLFNLKKKILYFPIVYYFDEELFLKSVQELKQNQLKVTHHNKNYLKGTIKVGNDKRVLFTTIPYEKGWTILVDGKQQEYHKIFDTFIGLDLEVGTHQLEFKFIPPLFKLGTLISLIASILFIFYLKFEKKIINFIINYYFKYEEIINYLIAGGLTTLVSIGSYGLFTRIFKFNYFASSLLSFIMAVIFAYFVNKIFVFKTNFKDLKQLIIEMYQFLKYRLLSLGIDLGLMVLLIEKLHFHDIIAKIIVQVIIVILNYLFSKIFIFKQNELERENNVK